jgi:uncharacterized protein YndB with AHSA1/START domain
LAEDRAMIEPTVSVSTTIAARREEVWHALTTPELIRRYFLGAEVRTDWEVGHPIAFSGEWQGHAYEDRGEIQSFVDGRELSYTHWRGSTAEPARPADRHLVRFTLDDVADGTRVTVTQWDDAAPRTVPEATRAEFRRNWERMIAGLKDLVEHAVAAR